VPNATETQSRRWKTGDRKRDSRPPAIGPAKRVIPNFSSVTVTVCRGSFSSFELLLCTRKRKGIFARGLFRSLPHCLTTTNLSFASPTAPRSRSSQLSTAALQHCSTGTQRGGSTCPESKGPKLSGRAAERERSSPVGGRPRDIPLAVVAGQAFQSERSVALGSFSTLHCNCALLPGRASTRFCSACYLSKRTHADSLPLPSAPKFQWEFQFVFPPPCSSSSPCSLHSHRFLLHRRRVNSSTSTSSPAPVPSQFTSHPSIVHCTATPGLALSPSHRNTPNQGPCCSACASDIIRSIAAAPATIVSPIYRSPRPRCSCFWPLALSLVHHHHSRSLFSSTAPPTLPFLRLLAVDSLFFVTLSR
jgi:hypothetical protein